MAMRESVVFSLCMLVALTSQKTVKSEDGKSDYLRYLHNSRRRPTLTVKNSFIVKVKKKKGIYTSFEEIVF